MGPAEPTSFGPGDSLVVRLAYDPADLCQDSGVLSLFGNDEDTVRAECHIDDVVPERGQRIEVSYTATRY